jgi:hypothetical protein
VAGDGVSPRVAAGDSEGQLMFLDPEAGTVLSRLQGHGSGLYTLAVVDSGEGTHRNIVSGAAFNGVWGVTSTTRT